MPPKDGKAQQRRLVQNCSGSILFRYPAYIQKNAKRSTAIMGVVPKDSLCEAVHTSGHLHLSPELAENAVCPQESCVILAITPPAGS